MSWEDTLLYVGAWAVGGGIVAFLVYGLDKLFPVEGRDWEPGDEE